MKSTDAEFLAKIIFESSRTPTVVQEVTPSKRAMKEAEEKLLNMRRVFDEKYNPSTPLELMRP